MSTYFSFFFLRPLQFSLFLLNSPLTCRKFSRGSQIANGLKWTNIDEEKIREKLERDKGEMRDDRENRENIFIIMMTTRLGQILPLFSILHRPTFPLL